MTFEKRFQELFKKLNKEQREAVEAIEGPVFVVAGPGTGKTSVLTLRIANILKKTDISPDAILALTFSDSGAAAMRRKLATIIGSAAYRVRINTFHSFANDLIKTYPDKFPRIIGAEHMEDLTARQLMQAVIDETKLKILRPRNAPDYYVAKCLAAIKELKRENFLPGKFKKLADQQGVAKTKELARVYLAYEKKLAKWRLYDFEDMIMEAARVLERDKDFLLKIQEETQYILADEHQDANNSQNRLLALLSSYDSSPNLFIVGDEKQAIYRFQGASLENFLYFQRLYPKARLITLTQNYRSHQKILDAAHDLILNNPILSEAPRSLRTIIKNGQKIKITELDSREGERNFIAQEVKKRIAASAPAASIAILTRENKDIEPMERTLVMVGVPAARFSGADALAHIRIDAFLQFLQAIIEPSDDFLAKILFFDFLNLPPHEVFLLLEKARKERVLILAVLHKEKNFKNFANRFTHFSQIAKNEPLVLAFNQIADESGFRTGLAALSDATEVLPLFEALLRTVERFAEREKGATVADFLKHLVEARRHEVEILADAPTADLGVKIMTAHRAKGLEFDSVFILHANDGVWGGRRHRHDFNLPIFGGEENHETEDERRLFYVALTRARKEIIITHHNRGEDNRERLPSRFVAEIGEQHLDKILPTVQPILLVKSLLRPKLLADKNYLNALFLERGLSVTHLNNYLNCPWRYFFRDLIRLPQSQTTPLLYGSAIHAALKNYFDAYAREEALSVKEAVKLFEKYLYRTHLGERDFRALAVVGKKELAGYLRAWNFPRAIFNEYKIIGIPLEITVGQTIELNGKLDKVELLTGDEINVVDYKTGKPKSRNETAKGNYKRQLVFYKLLINGAKRWRLKNAVLDFIQPLPSGRYKRETFEISDEETKELAQIIKTVSREILDLSFWKKTCGDKDCEFCRLREQIK